MYESTDKMVSHPDHYQSEATDTGNIIKYACRWKKKNGVQDLEKIIWYARHLIEHIKY